MDKAGLQQVQAFEARAFYGAAGVHLSVRDLGPGAGATLVDVVLPWAVRTLTGLGSGVAHQFSPRAELSTADTVGRLRDPRRLEDLLYDGQGGQLYCRGAIRSEAAASKSFLTTALEADHLRFAPADDVRVLDNGFATHSHWTGEDSPRVRLERTGLRYIEEQLHSIWRGSDTCSLTSAGDALGHFAVRVDDDEESFGPLNWARQDIRALRFTARVASTGLELAGEAELHPIAPEVHAAHFEVRQRAKKGALTSFKTFGFETTVPWAYLTARESPLLQRAKERGWA